MEAFSEEQNFIKNWWMLMLAILVLSGAPIYASSNQPIDELIFPLIIMVIVIVFFYFLSLHSRIDDKGISVKFGFFQRHFKEYKWENIKSVEIRKYNPIWEYGGWGYRGWNRRNRAFSVSGNIGLQITLNDGNVVMVGTKESEKMKTYLLYLKGKYQIAALAAIN
jgi:hypothetical protein